MSRETDGATLIELLVASAIALLLGSSLLMLTVQAHDGFGAQPAAIDAQERLRVAVETLQGGLLVAGSGPGTPIAGLSLGALVPAVLPYRIGLRGSDPPGTFRDDVLSIVRASRESPAVAIDAPFDGVGTTVPLRATPGCPLGRPACGIEEGASVLLVAPGGPSDLLGVSLVGPASVVLEARGRTSGRRYPAGSWLVPVAVSVHYLRPATGADGPLLARYDGYRSDLPGVDHVVRLSFEYFGDPQPPAVRVSAGVLGDSMTYGPAPPALGEDDDQDSWGAGENCVVAVENGRQVPRLAVLGDAGSPLRPLGAGALTDGPWCPDASSPSRFDADLLRVRRVRVSVRVEAAEEAFRGSDPRLFVRPGTARSAARTVPDQQAVFDIALRAAGGAGR